jgi:16S rRNA (adenine1518-N6/adenine1519-N6)-dimethyltransferase
MADPADLPPLRETIETYGLGAKKSLGQHFLLDLNITRKIARIGEIIATDTVIEVGPGPGGLTRALLETGARVIAIERDSRCIEALQELGSFYPGKLTLIEDDALAVDEQQLLQDHGVSGTVRLASNLPYNISTELLIKWLKASPVWWSSLTLMFQKEVGDRILAGPGSKTFGRLGVITQAVANPSHGFTLPARAFTPPPKVDSVVLHITPKAEIDFDIPSLEKLTAAAFSQRRKMLRASLKPLFGAETEAKLAEIGLEPTLRAEQIDTADYIRLSRLV